MKSETLIRQKMELEGLSEAAIRTLLHGVEELKSGRKMTISEEELCPIPGLPNWEDLVSDAPEADPELLGQMVIIKLNGGLGTSMGLQQANRTSIFWTSSCVKFVHYGSAPAVRRSCCS